MKIILNTYRNVEHGFSVKVTTCNAKVVTTVNVETCEVVKFSRSKFEWMIEKGVFVEVAEVEVAEKVDQVIEKSKRFAVLRSELRSEMQAAFDRVTKNDKYIIDDKFIFGGHNSCGLFDEVLGRFMLSEFDSNDGYVDNVATDFYENIGCDERAVFEYALKDFIEAR